MELKTSRDLSSTSRWDQRCTTLEASGATVKMMSAMPAKASPA